MVGRAPVQLQGKMQRHQRRRGRHLHSGGPGFPGTGAGGAHATSRGDQALLGPHSVTMVGERSAILSHPAALRLPGAGVWRGRDPLLCRSSGCAHKAVPAGPARRPCCAAGAGQLGRRRPSALHSGSRAGDHETQAVPRTAAWGAGRRRRPRGCRPVDPGAVAPAPPPGPRPWPARRSAAPGRRGSPGAWFWRPSRPCGHPPQPRSQPRRPHRLQLQLALLSWFGVRPQFGPSITGELIV
mmetsp:Transcript_26549/g.79310  ORF Transcript_26549/g.79310 Transcript_26549/m.79310 type:complete len:240 (+) Transcript_26549:503-1222(+)